MVKRRSYRKMSWDEKQGYSRLLRNNQRRNVRRVSRGGEALELAPPALRRPSRPTFRCTGCGTEVDAPTAMGHADRCNRGGQKP